MLRCTWRSRLRHLSRHAHFGRDIAHRPASTHAPANDIFDRAAKVRHRVIASRAADAAEYDYLRDEVAQRLTERLVDVSRSFENAVDLGCGGGASLAVALQNDQRGGGVSKVRSLLLCDEAPAILERARSRLVAEPALPTPMHFDFRVVEEEALPFAPNSFDLALSSMSLHWVNDLPGTLWQINRALRPDGLFLGAMMGGDTLHELRVALQLAEEQLWGGVSAHVSPLAQVRDVGSVLSRGNFVLTTVDVDELVVEYSDLATLMRHLKGMAENNAVRTRRVFFGRRAFARTEEIYRERFAGADGGLRATFQIIYMIGWKAHGSQPAPLSRGSAQHSLADLASKRASEQVTSKTRGPSELHGDGKE